MSKEKQEPITQLTKMPVFSKNSRFAKINAFSYLDERSLNKLNNKKLSHSLPQTNKDEDHKNQEIHVCFSPSQDLFFTLKKLMLKINPGIVFSNEMDNFSANTLTFDRLMSKWDEYLLDKEFIEKLSTDQRIARLVRKVNQKCLELLVGTMTKMTTESYELFTRTAQKRLALGESIQNITKELANLSSYQSEYIRNTLLKRLDTASTRIVFERFVMLAISLTELGNYFSGQAVYQGLFYSDIQQLFDKRNWNGISPQIKVALHYLESLYGAGELSRKKLAQIINSKEGYKLPVVNNITTKFELEFAGQEENLKLSKMKVEEEIEEINQAKSEPCINKKIEGLYQLNKLIIESLKEDLNNKVRSIENSILELSRFKQTYLEKELKEHIVPFNINSLIFSDELQNEIKNKQVELYLLNHDLIRDLKSVRSNCEHKQCFIRQEKEYKKSEEKSLALFFDCLKQVQQIVHRFPKLLRPQALKKFYANFKKGFQNLSKQTYSYINECDDLVSELTILTNELTEMQKKYERSLMKRSKKIRSQSNFIDRSKSIDAIQDQLYVLPSNNMNQLLALHEICIKKIANLKKCKVTEQKGQTLFKSVNNNQKKLQEWMAVSAIVDEAIIIFARLISKAHIQSECHAEMNRLMVACSLIPHAQSSHFKVEKLIHLFRGVKQHVDRNVPSVEKYKALVRMQETFDALLNYMLSLQENDTYSSKFQQIRIILTALVSSDCQSTLLKIEYLESYLSQLSEKKSKGTTNSSLILFFNEKEILKKSKKSTLIGIISDYLLALKNFHFFNLDQHNKEKDDLEIVSDRVPNDTQTKII